MIVYSLLFSLLSFFSCAQAITIKHTPKHTGPHDIESTINLKPQSSQEYIYQEHIHFSVDNPHVTIENITYSIPATSLYSKEFRHTKLGFNEPVSITLKLHSDQEYTSNAHIHFSYLTSSHSAMQEMRIPVKFAGRVAHQPALHQEEAPKKMPISFYPDAQQSKKSLTEKVQEFVQKADTLWLQLLLSILLGLLLSLTPCIYPMIPITIGILHSHGKKSLLFNFAGSLCYAMGIATTFACLGLFTAFAGAQFGSLLSNPIFVCIFVGFLGYMSLTMLNIVHLYIPSFMQRQINVKSKFGPFVTSFLFGAVSGTVASPCVSPGLALILGIVATLGNKFLGFLLLFCFGIGLSIPLVIIGTFSSSLQLLPRSGQWMEEIKKGIGMLMLGMSLYFLQPISSDIIFAWLMVAYALFAGLFFIIDGSHNASTTKQIKNLIGVACIALTVVLGIQAYEKTFFTIAINEESLAWHHDYQEAKTVAAQNHKLLLVDFYGKACSMCKAIDKKIFKQPAVAQALDNKVVFVKINGNKSEHQELLHSYNVHGFPTILVINPETEAIIHQWTGDLYNLTAQEFIAFMQKLHL